jgi:cellulose synthase/poly-beta-1,6-N-acetylglucosamine synthase-like glycosyltransferase
MKIAFVQYLKNKNKKKIKLHNAELNMAKKPQIA